jgi:hypothetical protein
VSQVTTKAPAHPYLLQYYSHKLSYRNSQDAPLLTNALRKCGIYTQWSFTKSQRRVKFCHSQVNEWNWRISSEVKLLKLRRPKSHALPHMWIIDLKRMQ